MTPPDDAAKRVPLGPIGRYLIQNLTQIREARRLSYRELSDKLEELGRPIPTLGLSRIEKGTRRVDADDLVALAIALNVSPIALLLPRDAGPYDEIALTTGVSVTARAGWEWSAGNLPLALPGAAPWTWRDIAEFEENSHPAWESGLTEWRERMEQRKAEMEELRRLANEPIPVEETLPSVATAIVTSSRGVLVGRRNDGKPPWTFIAGEVEEGETPEFAATREVKEETGLEARARDEIGRRVHPRTGREMIYVAAEPVRPDDLGVFVGDEAELAEVRWVSLAEADHLMAEYGMFGPVHDYLEREIGG